MKTTLATFAFAAATLMPTLALATPATVTGPLGDAQLVRGKKLGMTYLHYGPTGANTSAVATVHYGFHGHDNEATAVMSPTGYGNQVAFLDVPASASGFWYSLTVSDGTTQNNNGVPFVLSVHDRAVSVTKLAPTSGTMVVKYAGPVTTTYDTYMHLGWNNWNNVGNAFMARTEFSYSKAGVYYDYNSANIDAPWWANYMDYVFEDARGGGTWDNNGGADWHQSLKPFVQTSVSNNGAGLINVSIQYSGGGLNPVILHYGTNGWLGVADVAMQPYNGGWQAYLTVGSGTHDIEFAFTDGNGHWENNYGANWTLLTD